MKALLATVARYDSATCDDGAFRVPKEYLSPPRSSFSTKIYLPKGVISGDIIFSHRNIILCGN